MFKCTLETRIEDPWLLLATVPLVHLAQALKITPLLQFTPKHLIWSTPLPIFKSTAIHNTALIQVTRVIETVCDPLH